MPGTYSQLLLHIAFSTKRRERWITPEIADRLDPYMGGTIRAEKGVLYDIGGVEDHVHLYPRWRTDGSISDLMRTVKARSSKWVHDTFPKLGAFAWQEGYSVFSVCKSQEDAVKKYIAGQAEHHKKEDFKSELLRLLRAHGIEFDERYVFEWPRCLRPSEATLKNNDTFHGLRFAPPVATALRPVGANAERPTQSALKVAKPPSRRSGGLWFAPAKGSPEAKAAAKAEKPPGKREKFQNDPKVVEAARELRDRYIEQINAGLLLPPSACGKYDVSRQLEAAPSAMKVAPAVAMLEAA